MSPLELVSPLHFLQIECDRERLWCIRKTVAFCLTLISRRSEYFRGVWMSRRHCISSDLMPNASVIHQYTSVWHIKWYETHLQSIMFHSTMRQWTQWPRLWLISLNTDTAANNRHLFIFKAELCSQVECKVIIAEQVKWSTECCWTCCQTVLQKLLNADFVLLLPLCALSKSGPFQWAFVYLRHSHWSLTLFDDYFKHVHGRSISSLIGTGQEMKGALNGLTLSFDHVSSFQSTSHN